MTAEAIQIPALLSALSSVQSGSQGSVTILPFTAVTDPNINEAVFFLKPEALDAGSGVAVEKLLDLVLGQFAKSGVSVHAALVLGYQYLQQFDVIARHYGVINSISRNGQDAISDAAKAKLQELFGEELAKGAQVKGGHQLIELYPDLTPKALDVLVSNVGSKKLAPGTYCAKVVIDGATYLLLNAFHPFQIEHFTRPGRAIIVLVVRSQTPWKTLRNEVLGATNPANAAAGSLRRTFLEQRGELGLKQVDQGNNAVHLSAGPLEGMVELGNYFSDYTSGQRLDLAETAFGKLLLANGFGHDQLAGLAKNPQFVVDGKQVSAFDLTEETQPAEAVALLKQNPLA
ncbi:MAG: hypothetical protein OHK0022_26830 [Roseiflexaceae bacterium]